MRSGIPRSNWPKPMASRWSIETGFRHIKKTMQRDGLVARISFVDARRWLAPARPGAELPDLVVNPWRPGRFEPRVRKRRPKEYDLMNRPRGELRQALAAQGVAA